MSSPKLRIHETTRQRDAWATRVAGTTACGRTRQTVREAWVETVVDDQWMAAYRLVPGLHGEPVIAELRLFPLERTTGRPPGRWSAEVLGIEVKIPEGGISADLVRHVRIGEHRQVGSEFARWLKELPAQVISKEHFKHLRSLLKDQTFTVYMPAVRPTPRLGRPPTRSEKFYAKLARDYAQRVAQGSPRPTADVAERRRLDQSRVRDLLHEARQRGLLSRTGQGRSGGELTPKALAILNARKMNR